MAEPPKGQKCENCRYHYTVASYNGDILHKCRRYPPQMIETENAFGASRDPAATDWCGEWSPENPETIEEGAATLARMVLLGDLTAARALVDRLLEQE